MEGVKIMDMIQRLKGIFGRKAFEDLDKKDFINNYLNDHDSEFRVFLDKAITAERYYKNDTDIKRFDRFRDVNQKQAGLGNNPLRNADNRVPHNWHGLLLNQKASYLGNVPPKFDTLSEEYNEKIKKVLGSKYKKVFFDLLVNAGNCGVAWLHYWIDSSTRELKFMSINPKECFPVWSNRGDGDLTGMIRRYGITDDEGSDATCFEYWDSRGVTTYIQKDKKMMPYNQFRVIDPQTKQSMKSNWYNHEPQLQGRIPFIACPNNKEMTGDLVNIKGLIDTYDKVFSGFVNDLDDIQQMIFVLTNYTGTDKEAFLKDMLYYKAVTFEQHEGDDNSGLEQMTIEIPTEAREAMLKITQEQIFIQGQGVNPNKENMNNNSGIALKFLYSLLDMKCSLLESQFVPAFEEFVKVMVSYYFPEADIDSLVVNQTWERSAISDDAEMAEIISRVAVVSSDVAIAKNNPLVGEDWQTEVDLRKQQKIDELQMADMYSTQPGAENGSYKNIMRQFKGTSNQMLGRDKQLVNQNAGHDPEGDG